MAFTAKDVSTLREMTGVGMMDCKKALTETDGDIEKAVVLLREKGLAAAAKKAGRVAAEGACCAIVNDNGVAAIVEINSETDFAAKSDNFQNFLTDVTKIAATTSPTDIDDLKSKAFNADMTVEKALQEKVLTIGENLQLRRFACYNENVNVAYNHMGGKIAVLVNIVASDNLKDSAEVQELGKDVSMQIAAMRPLWLGRDNVASDTLANEKEIMINQLKQDPKNMGKPEAVLAKIVEGRVGKYYSEVCLLEQPFVKENKLTVAQYVAQKAKDLGGTLEINAFTRFEKGEGIAKREDDFAAEVASMTK